MLSQNDFEQLNQKGILPGVIEQQIMNFRLGFPFVILVAPAIKGHGIKDYDETEIDRLASVYEKYGPEHDVLKFVPASGAASRMFKHLFEFMQSFKGTEADLLNFEKDKSFNSVFYFISNIKKFAFIADLEQVLSRDGLNLDDLLAKSDFVTIIEYLLTPRGLDYGNLPKGLLRFHQYDDVARRSVEEHLVEGAHYAKTHNGDVNIHFTVSPEHLDRFQSAIDIVLPNYSKMYGVKFHISFSVQKASTDTVAVDMNNEPFRESDNKLVFRPGGHGALIENLNDLKGEIIFIKNIDNIVPDRLMEPTFLYKKVIGGLLIELKEKTNHYLQLLDQGNLEDHKLAEIVRFAQHDLEIQFSENFNDLRNDAKKRYLFSRLNRPMRICGMVKNEGEPGGGPFWLENGKGEVSLQIVESSQIDMNNPAQKKILNESTHFNPVDLVCSVKDYRGRHFELHKYVDPTTGFISIKSKDGKNLKAQELPGLWNGAMADWITIFVETPVITFNPVKTINDLLRDQHLNY